MPSENPITTSQDLQALLRVLLGDLLGTFSTGQAAIWIQGAFPPARGTGLQCIIKHQPLMLKHDATGYNSQANQIYEWDITLTTDPDLAGLEALEKAVNRIRLRFPRHRERVLPYVDGKKPQIQFLLTYTNTVNCVPVQLY